MRQTIYDPATGQILAVRTSLDPTVPDEYTGMAVIDGAHNADTHYVDIWSARPNVLVKVATTATPDTLTVPGDGVTPVTFSTVPNPSTVTVVNAETGERTASTVTDGTAEITFDTAGTYRVTFTAVQYLDAAFTVTVT